MTRDQTSRRLKANKFPRKQRIRFKSPAAVVLINFLSFIVNLPPNSTNTNGESLASPPKFNHVCCAMMRDQFKSDTRFNCTGLVGEGWSFVHMQMTNICTWTNDHPSPTPTGLILSHRPSLYLEWTLISLLKNRWHCT